MHKFALGRLGWSERQYFESTPYMLFAACEGYFDKIEDQERMIRKQTHLLLLPHVKNGSSDLKTFWGALFSDENVIEANITPLTEDELLDMVARHNMVFNQIKN